MNTINSLKQITDFFKEENSKRERWTITNRETWLVENGRMIKLIGKEENIHKELISEGKKEK